MRFSASIVFSLAYGKHLETPDQTEIVELSKISENLLQAVHKTGDQVIEIFPALNCLPRWFGPWKKMDDRFHSMAVKVFQGYAENGKATSSWNWTKRALELNRTPKLKELRDMSETENFYLLSVLQEAGSEMTTPNLEVFVMTCVIHPEAMQQR